MRKLLWVLILSLTCLADRCPDKQAQPPLTTNCGNTAKWFNSTGKPLNVTATVTDHCPNKDSSISLYRSETDNAPPVWAVDDGKTLSFDLSVPAGGYIKITCNGDGEGDCTLQITILN